MISIEKINAGFGNMADEYDAIRHTNIPVRIMRDKFYETVLSFVNPPAKMLELNCGSGIDAEWFAAKGFDVTATDISDKMLLNASGKKNPGNLVFKKLNFMEDFTQNGIEENTFDVVVSNLGGLNCTDNLKTVNDSVNKILKPGGFFIAAVMPQFSLWEFLLLFKGEFSRAFRRLKRNGIYANVGGEKVFVKYYSPVNFYKYFKSGFQIKKLRALRVLAPPPPAADWYIKYPFITSVLDRTDNLIENFYIPSFIGDFYIIVLKKR